MGEQTVWAAIWHTSGHYLCLSLEPESEQSGAEVSRGQRRAHLSVSMLPD